MTFRIVNLENPLALVEHGASWRSDARDDMEPVLMTHERAPTGTRGRLAAGGPTLPRLQDRGDRRR
jgi:hypothetical protein